MALNRVLAPLALGLATLAACAHSAPAPTDPVFALVGTDGVTRNYPELTQGAPATMLVFFAKDCPCMEAHDERLTALAARLSATGVRVYLVDSEFDATVDSDRAEAKRRSYPFPILLDPGAKVATALGAQYASFSAIFDSTGALRYRGGYDSTMGDESPDTQRWVAMALDDLLANRPVAHPAEKALGCALRRW